MSELDNEIYIRVEGVEKAGSDVTVTRMGRKEGEEERRSLLRLQRAEEIRDIFCQRKLTSYKRCHT